MTETEYHGELVAAVDESSPAAGAGIVYVISTAIVLDPSEVAAACRAMIGDRVRPFHWRREGVRARGAMLELVNERVVEVLCQYRSVPRTRQVEARRAILQHQLPLLDAAGVSHLIIESGDKHGDTRDQATVLDTFPNRPVPYRYEWRAKTEPLLWMADAISGAVSEHLSGKGDDAYEQINGIVSPEYLA